VTSLSSQQLEILRCAAKTGDILRLTYSGGPIWIRAGNVDLGDEKDRGDQALYVDALQDLVQHGLAERQGKDYYRLTGRGFTAAKRAIKDIDNKIEATQRGKLLALLYSDRHHKYSSVKSSSFSPEISKREISRMGHDFFSAKLIEDYPMDNGDNYFMRISFHGRSVWEGKEKSILDMGVPINILPEIQNPAVTISPPTSIGNQRPTAFEQRGEDCPSSLEAGVMKVIWKSRLTWVIIVVAPTVIAAFALYAAQPDEIKLKIWSIFFGNSRP